MNRYESGGVSPLPPHLQDTLRKCGECGHVFVGSTISPCPECADMDKRAKAETFKTDIRRDTY